MKLTVLFALFMAVGLMLVTGCVTMTPKNTVNATTETQITQLSTTPVPDLNKTINATANRTSYLKGSLRISISGITYPANLSVVIDDEIVGTVNPTTPPVPDDFRGQPYGHGLYGFGMRERGSHDEVRKVRGCRFQ